MDTVVTTILFDGRFWVAIIEKIDPLGIIHVGRYVFGAEPDYNDLLSFYLYRYSDITAYESPVRVRVKTKRKISEETRSTNKAKAAFKEAQSTALSERKSARREEAKKNERERYLMKAEKKKEKRRGH